MRSMLNLGGSPMEAAVVDQSKKSARTANDADGAGIPSVHVVLPTQTGTVVFKRYGTTISSSIDPEFDEALPLTEERLHASIVYVAECVIADGPRFSPFLDKLVAELADLQGGRDPISRARAILATARANLALR